MLRVFAAVAVFALGLATADAGQVEASNRTKVDCSLVAGDTTIPVAAGTTESVFIGDEIGDRLRARCPGSQLDRDETECKLVLGGSGPGEKGDKASEYKFRYVKQVHVFANMGRWLVCSSM